MTRALVTLFVSLVVQARPGALAKDGCHLDRKVGKRHCHNDDQNDASVLQDRVRTVLRVVDGDTVVLDGDEKVRLIGINTPEMKDTRPARRYWAKRAAVFLADQVDGEKVRLEFVRERRDRYGRTLAYVYLTNGKHVNAEVVRQGYSRAFTRHRFKHQKSFVLLEGEAKGARRGMWGQE